MENQGQHRLLLTIGPSRAGKSSFINTLGKESHSLVGGINGESTTFNVIPCNISIGSQQRSSSRIIIYDVPGFHDSMQRMTKSEIKGKVTESILDITQSDSLAAVLVFEALSAQVISLRETLKNVESMLGPGYKQSTIVVLTKADEVRYAEMLEARKQALEEICREHNLAFIYWENNHRNGTVDDANFERQVEELQTKISSRVPYLLNEVKNCRKKVEERAAELERITPKIIETIEIEVPSSRVEAYIVPVQKQKIEYEERLKWAGGAGKVIGKKKSYTVPVIRHYTDNETHYREVPTTEKVKKQIEKPYPFEYFLGLAKKEIMNEVRNRYRGANAA